MSRTAKPPHLRRLPGSRLPQNLHVERYACAGKFGGQKSGYGTWAKRVLFGAENLDTSVIAAGSSPITENFMDTSGSNLRFSVSSGGLVEPEGL